MYKLCLLAACVAAASADRPSNGYGLPSLPSLNGGSATGGNRLNGNYEAPPTTNERSDNSIGGLDSTYPITSLNNGRSGNGFEQNFDYSTSSSSNGGSDNVRPSDNYAAPSRNVFNGASFATSDRYSNGGDQLGDLADLIPGGGVPGEDFPVLSSVPDTGFLCEDQAVSGYYADDAQEAGCQVFHICQLRESGQVQQDSFLCPNGTVFNQQYLVCDWWYNFDCATAQDFYAVNEQIGVAPGSSNGDGYGNTAAASDASGSDVGYETGIANSRDIGYGNGNDNGRRTPNGNGYSDANGGSSRQNGGGYGF